MVWTTTHLHRHENWKAKIQHEDSVKDHLPSNEVCREINPRTEQNEWFTWGIIEQ